MTLWLTIRTPQGAVCWPVDDDPAVHEDQINRARVVVGFPPGEEWIRDPAGGWHLSLSPGPPHERIGATPRDAAELERVPAEDVQAWREADTAACRRRRMDAAHAVLTALDDTDRAELIAKVVQPARGRTI